MTLQDGRSNEGRRANAICEGQSLHFGAEWRKMRPRVNMCCYYPGPFDRGVGRGRVTGPRPSPPPQLSGTRRQPWRFPSHDIKIIQLQRLGIGGMQQRGAFCSHAASPQLLLIHKLQAWFYLSRPARTPCFLKSHPHLTLKTASGLNQRHFFIFARGGILSLSYEGFLGHRGEANPSSAGCSESVSHLNRQKLPNRI